MKEGQGANSPILRAFVSMMAAMVVVAFSSCNAETSNSVQSSQPNIIYIMADDLGYADLGSFGSTKINTPNIDRLAKEGTRFTQFYSGSPVCASARCVLMTGLHTGHALIRSNSPKVGGQLEVFGEGAMRLSLTGREATVASVLQNAGYATGVSGKWGIGEPNSQAQPTQMGFDEWLGYLNQNHAPYYYTDFLWRNMERQIIPENKDGKREVYSNDLMRDFAIGFIQDNKDRPFFLYLPFSIPHSLMEVPSLGEYADKDWPEDAKIYAAMISRLDSYVGQLVAELDRLGIADNTAVFFTSDNGPVGNDRTVFFDSAGGSRGTKGTVYEGGLRVPLIVKWPGIVAEGASNDTPWMFADVFPTLVDMAGESYIGDLDGVSLLPTVRGEKQDLSDHFLYWEFPRTRLSQAGRLGNWKGVRHGLDQPLELYNLQNDPFETNDVSKINPSVVADFEKRFSDEHVPSPHWPAN